MNTEPGSQRKISENLRGFKPTLRGEHANTVRGCNKLYNITQINYWLGELKLSGQSACFSCEKSWVQIWDEHIFVSCFYSFCFQTLGKKCRCRYAFWWWVAEVAEPTTTIKKCRLHSNDHRWKITVTLGLHKNHTKLFSHSDK